MKKRCTLVLFIVTLAVLTSGCAVTINSIRENPQRYSGKTVILTGEVLNVINIPLVDTSIFLFGSDDGKVPVVSSQKHTKGESYIMIGKVMAFPESDSKEASARIVKNIADFLVQEEMVEQKKAEKAAEKVLAGLYRVSEGLGQAFFIMEEKTI